MKSILAAVLACLLAVSFASDADAQCAGAGGIPFNCQSGTMPGAADLFLGGGTTAAGTPNQTIKWTGLEAAMGMFTLVPQFSGGGTANFLRADGSWAVPPGTGGGSGLNQLTGDVTAGPGTGSQAATLATVNSNVGTFQGLTVNAKGLVTAAANQSYLTAPVANGSLANDSMTIAGHVIDLGGTQAIAASDLTNGTTGTGAVVLAGAPTITLGNATGLPFSGLVSLPTTLAGYSITNGATNGANSNITSLTGLTTALTVAQGGTGVGTLTANSLVTSHGTSAFTGLAEVDGDCVLGAAGAWTAGSCGGGSSGTVISVAMTVPTIFSLSGSPITTSGTLAITLASQTANLVWASPNGSAGAPTFRTLVATDLPTIPFSQVGSTPTTLSGYGITNGATSGANSNITSLTGLTTQLSVGQGGTGAATITSNGLVIGHGTSPVTALAEVDGDCAVGSGGAWTAGSCGSGGSTTITLAPGLTSTPGTINTGTQTVTNGSTISLQTGVVQHTGNYTIATGATCADSNFIHGADATGSITFTLPLPGAACGLGGQSYTFADTTGHGYTLAATGGTADFIGLGAAATTFAVPDYGSVSCTSDGVSNWACQGGYFNAAGGGSVTSVAMSVPSWLTVTGSPITGSGTLAVTGTSESANLFLASPNGSAGAVTPRGIVTADLTGAVGMEIDLFYNGVPANSAILAKTFSRSTTIAASAPIKCNAIVGATSSATVTLAHVVSGTSTNIGTAVFAASGSAYEGCTATFSSATTFAVGDLLTATFPATADATLANVAISIPAVQ